MPHRTTPDLPTFFSCAGERLGNEPFTDMDENTARDVLATRV